MVALTRLSLGWPRTVGGAIAAVTALLALGVARLEPEVGYRGLLGSAHAEVTQLDGFLARYGGGFPLAAVWSCTESPCDHAVDSESLRMAHAVARSLERAPGVLRVDGPATSPLLVVEPLELPGVRRLAPGGTPAPDVEALAARAREDPLWVGHILSADGSAGAVVAHLEATDGPTAERVYAALEAALAPHEARGFRFYRVGGPVELVVAGGELARHTVEILPVMIVLIAGVLVGLFRSAGAAAFSLATVGVAVAWTLGAMGWMGWPHTSFTQALAPLVLVIGVCDAIHLVARYAARVGAGAGPAEREAALLAAARDVGAPCAMTTLTTGAAFASFATSGLESVARFGLAAAAGVGVALVLTFSLLPLLVARVSPRRVCAPEATRAWERAVTAVARAGIRRRKMVLASAAAVAAAAAAGVSGLRVEASFEDLYGSDSEVVRWAHAVERHLRAPDTLELSLDPPRTTPLDSAAALAVADRVAAKLSGLDGLGRATSIVVPLRHLNAALRQPDLRLESGDERAAARLRLLRLEDADLVSRFVDRRGHGLRVSVAASKPPQDRLRALLAEAEARVAASLPPGWRATVTGPLAVVGRMLDEIRATQLRSFAAAAGLVFALVALWLRSPSRAALAMAPTGLPVLAALGAMGGAGIALDVGTAMVATVVLGIAVDDAIHLLAAYTDERRSGAARAVAIVAAVGRAGRAIATTSLALATGFFALLLSPWHSIASFGAVAGVAILTALLAALLVLPALLGGGGADPNGPRAPGGPEPGRAGPDPVP